MTANRELSIDTPDGGTLAVFTHGLDTNPAVVLVHGYPDDHGVWNRVAGKLSEDFFVVTYDVRGAGRSFKPRRLRAYKLSRLAADLAAVIQAVSPAEPIHLVGHDWGSIQCWEAVTSPEISPYLHSFTTISGPCLDHVGHGLRKRGAFPGQTRRSWYIAAFHLPLLAPLGWRMGLARVWPWLLRRVEGVTAPAHPTRAGDAARGVSLYRANVIPRFLRPGKRYTNVPVQLIVPLRDRYVTPALACAALPWLNRHRRREVEAGHWVNLSHPDWLAARIREFALSPKSGKPT